MDAARELAEVVVEELGELGRRRRGGDAEELQLRRIARRQLAGVEGRLPALGMAPDDEAVAGIGLAHLAHGADRIEHRPPLAHPDQIGVRPGGAEAGIVGRDDDEAARQHLVDAGDDVDRVGKEHGRRAFLRNAGGRMGPGDHRPAALGRRGERRDHQAGYGDDLPVEPGRAVEDAVGVPVGERDVHPLDADERPRRPGEIGRRRIVEAVRRGRGREAEGDREAERRGRRSTQETESAHLPLLFPWRRPTIAEPSRSAERSCRRAVNAAPTMAPLSSPQAAGATTGPCRGRSAWPGRGLRRHGRRASARRRRDRPPRPRSPSR